MSELLTTADLAALLHVNVRTIMRRRAAGNLGIAEIDIAPPGARPQPRFRREDVEAHLRARTS